MSNTTIIRVDIAFSSGKTQTVEKTLAQARVAIEKLKAKQLELNEAKRSGAITADKYAREIAKVKNNLSAYTNAVNTAVKSEKAKAREVDNNTKLAERYRVALEKVNQNKKIASERTRDFTFNLTRVGAQIGSTIAVFYLYQRTVGNTVRAFVDWERGIAQVSTQMDTIDKTMGQKSLQIAEKYGLAIEDVNKALYDTVSVGIRAEEVMEFMDTAARLAIAGVTDLKTAVDGLTSVLTAYSLETSEAERVASAFFRANKFGKTTVGLLTDNIGKVVPVAAQANISYQEILGALAELTLGGLNTEEAVTALRQAIVGVTKPAVEAEKYLREFGVPVGAAEVRAAGLTYTLGKLAEAGKKIPDVISEMIPNVRALTGITALAGPRLEHLSMVIDDVNTNFGEASSFQMAFQTQMQTTGKELDIANSRLKEMQINVGRVLAPAYTFLAKNVVAATIAIAGLLSTMVGFNIFVQKNKITQNIASAFKSWKAGLFGLGVGLLTGLVAYIATVKKARDVSEEFAKSVSSEKGKVFELFRSLQDVNTSHERRWVIMNQINDEYGKFLNMQITDADNLEDQKRKQAEILKYIEAKAATEQKAQEVSIANQKWFDERLSVGQKLKRKLSQKNQLDPEITGTIGEFAQGTINYGQMLSRMKEFRAQNRLTLEEYNRFTKEGSISTFSMIDAINKLNSAAVGYRKTIQDINLKYNSFITPEFQAQQEAQAKEQEIQQKISNQRYREIDADHWEDVISNRKLWIEKSGEVAETAEAKNAAAEELRLVKNMGSELAKYKKQGLTYWQLKKEEKDILTSLDLEIARAHKKALGYISEGEQNAKEALENAWERLRRFLLEVKKMMQDMDYEIKRAQIDITESSNNPYDKLLAQNRRALLDYTRDTETAYNNLEAASIKLAEIESDIHLKRTKEGRAKIAQAKSEYEELKKTTEKFVELRAELYVIAKDANITKFEEDIRKLRESLGLQEEQQEEERLRKILELVTYGIATQQEYDTEYLEWKFNKYYKEELRRLGVLREVGLSTQADMFREEALMLQRSYANNEMNFETYLRAMVKLRKKYAPEISISIPQDNDDEMSKMQTVTGTRKIFQTTEEEPDSVERKEMIITQSLDFATDLNNALFDIAADRDNKEFEHRMKMLEKLNDSELDLLERKMKRGLITEGYYNKQREKLEAELQERKEALEREQFERNKRRSIAQATIDGALAIMKIWANTATTTEKILLTIASAANTALQIGTISAQKFAEGGPTFAAGGHVKSQKLGIIGEAGPEWVSPNWMMNDTFSGPIIKMLESYRTTGTPKYGIGGYTQRQISTTATAPIVTETMLINAIRELPEPIVFVEDIKTATERTTRVKQRADI